MLVLVSFQVIRHTVLEILEILQQILHCGRGAHTIPGGMESCCFSLAACLMD